MKTIYRLRPANEFLLEELKESYLWFSKPTSYKDTEDANVTSFVEKNYSIAESFERTYKDSSDILAKSKHIGICCFTEEIPHSNKWKKFPLGNGGVFIEYDREGLDTHFSANYGIGDCFNKVEYYNQPTSFKSFNKKYDILWDTDSDGGLWYKSLKEIENDEILRDELFRKMFTRINSDYAFQNESRIILGGHSIVEYDDNVKGYKISIPSACILKIYLHPETPKGISEELLKNYSEKVVASS